MKRILVVTTEPLPVPGGLTTGAGLRAWGLAEGLRSRGFPVTLATPLEGEQAISQAAAPTDDRVRYFRRPELPALIEREQPDIIVIQHWGLVYALPPLDIPLVIDLAGPHLLERLYWGNPDSNHDREEKLTALRRADFIICGGTFQRHYFYPYLAMAGFDVREDSFPVIPFSVSPEPVEGQPEPDAEPTFIYGGAFLAWQNPEAPIRWLLEELDRAGRGRLLFYGGSHPSMDASGGKFVKLYQDMQRHLRVEVRGWKPFADLIQEYAHQGHVALDLMEHNPERELAYTTRTMVYLQCGLPVIYNNYSELSSLITKNECGWCLDPTDEMGFRRLVNDILEDPTIAQSMRDRARAAARDQSWDRTIDPLATYCANPVKRLKTEIIEAEMTATALLKTESPDLTPPPSQNPAPSFSSLHRSIFPRPGRYLGVVVYFPVYVVAKYLQHRLKVSRSSRAQNNQGSAHV